MTNQLRSMQKLFLPNNHSKYRIRWEVCDNRTRKEISRLIRDNYDFDRIEESGISQVQEWERMSNNFRVKVFKSGKKKEVLFRKHIQLKKKNDINILDRISGFLRKNKIYAPQIIKTKDGQTSFFSGKNFYVMYEFIKGDHFKGTKKELEQAASEIALLHKILKVIPFKKEIEKKPLLLPPWTIAGWKKILNKARENKGGIDLIVQENADLLFEEAKLTHTMMAKSNKARRQIIHCDLHPQNTIFEKEKLKAIFDFEGVRMGELSRDVGYACHRLVRQFVVFQKKDWKRILPVGIKIFLREYEKINPLARKEVLLMPVFIKDELLRKLYKDLGLYYFRHYSKNIEGGELEKKLNLLKESRIIAEIINKLKR